jgi:SNF2 family DNA or RNA helicase
MLRRKKDDVEASVLPKVEITIPCPLSKTQVFWYKRLLMSGAKTLERVSKRLKGEADGCVHALSH